jgi:hypothetical protein
MSGAWTINNCKWYWACCNHEVPGHEPTCVLYRNTLTYESEPDPFDEWVAEVRERQTWSILDRCIARLIEAWDVWKERHGQIRETVD